MPASAGENDQAGCREIKGGFDFGDRLGQNRGLERLALTVLFLQDQGQFMGPDRIVGQKELEGGHGRAQAARSIQAWCQGIADGAGIDHPVVLDTDRQ